MGMSGATRSNRRVETLFLSGIPPVVRSFLLVQSAGDQAGQLQRGCRKLSSWSFLFEHTRLVAGDTVCRTEVDTRINRKTLEQRRCCCDDVRVPRYFERLEIPGSENTAMLIIRDAQVSIPLYRYSRQHA